MIKNRKFLLAVAAVLVVVAVVSLSVGKAARLPKVKNGSNLACDDVYTYYNDVKNNIIRVSFQDKKSEVFAENMVLLSACGGEVLAKSGESVVIVNSDGNVIDELMGVQTDHAQLEKGCVYYKASDMQVYSFDRERKATTVVLPVQIDEFVYDSNKIYFTTDGKMLFVYDMTTGMPMGYFGDKSIKEFSINDGCLFYSDANEGYKGTVMYLSNGAEEKTKIRSQKFVLRNGVLVYIENANDSKGSYKLKFDPLLVH